MSDPSPSSSVNATGSAPGSPQAEYLRALYREWTEIMADNPALPMRALRSLLDEQQKPTVEPEGVTYKEETVGSVGGLWALPLDADRDEVLLFMHGGGFTAGSPASHRKLAAHLAKAVGAIAFLPDYRLAPEHVYPAQVEDCVAVYEALLDRGYEARRLSSVGDSAGGGLAVSVPLALRRRGVPLPALIIAMSPWVDMANEGPTVTSNAETDVLVSATMLEVMAEAALGGALDPGDPLASPLHADLSGLPPMYLSVGGAETVLDNATRLADRARAAGVEVTLSVGEGMQHVFPLLAGRAPEADEEIRRMAHWYRTAG